MNTCNCKTCSTECCNSHMKCLRKPCIVKHSSDGIYINILSVHIIETSRTIHPCICSDNQNTGSQSAYTHQKSAKPMEPFIEFVPSVKEESQCNSFYKNAVPSNENGIPKIESACSINLGHSNPNSKDNIVPDTAPVANNIATPLLQALVSPL